MKDDSVSIVPGTQTVERALEILKYIADEKGQVPLNAICQTFRLNRTTAWRILSALVKSGFIERDAATKCYRLGIASTLLSTNAAARNEPIIRHSRQPMQELLNLTQESIILAIPGHNCTMAIAQLSPPHSVMVRDYTNTTSTLYGTSNGKIALGFMNDDELKEFMALPRPPFTTHTITDREKLLEEVKIAKERGYGMIECELDESENGISAPVMHGGRPIAYISVAGPSFRFTKEKMLAIVPALLSACRRVEESFKAAAR